MLNTKITEDHMFMISRQFTLDLLVNHYKKIYPDLDNISINSKHDYINTMFPVGQFSIKLFDPETKEENMYSYEFDSNLSNQDISHLVVKKLDEYYKIYQEYKDSLEVNNG